MYIYVRKNIYVYICKKNIYVCVYIYIYLLLLFNC